MKRITASLVCLMTTGLIAAGTSHAADETAVKSAPPVTTEPVAATTPTAADANKTFLLIRKRVMLQKEISALEGRVRNTPATPELRKELADIEAKISELQSRKRNLIMESEPKLKDLYRQLGEVSAEIAKVPPATPAPKP